MTSIIESNLPSNIRRHIAQHNIHFTLHSNTFDKERIEVSLLEDEQGYIQVFVPNNSIAHLDQIRELTQRPQLQPFSYEKLQRYKILNKVETLPALVDLFPITTIVDQSLQHDKNVFIHSGHPDILIEVNTQTLISQNNCQFAPISTPLPLNDYRYELSLFDHDRQEIHNAVTQFTTLRIRQRLAETLEIPPLSSSAQAIIQLRADPDANIQQLSRIIEHDPSLAAQVVSWASSSFYAAPGSIKSVQDAIVRVLGFDLVMNLALGLSLGKTLALPENIDHGSADYWQTAVYTATCNGAIINCIPKEFRPSFGLCYLAGLLHNFGYLILAHTFKPYFKPTLEKIMLNRHLAPEHVEKHALGITRNQITSNLMHTWNMPDEITLAIRYQSDPHYLGPCCDQAHLNYLTNHLLQDYGLLPKTQTTFNPLVYEHLHLDIDKVEQVMTELTLKKQAIEAIVYSMSQ